MAEVQNIREGKRRPLASLKIVCDRELSPLVARSPSISLLTSPRKRKHDSPPLSPSSPSTPSTKRRLLDAFRSIAPLRSPSRTKSASPSPSKSFMSSARDLASAARSMSPPGLPRRDSASSLLRQAGPTFEIFSDSASHANLPADVPPSQQLDPEDDKENAKPTFSPPSPTNSAKKAR
ncbi:uncharacterized protein L969DRAFT_87374 [Mixia osmundae IAM 14324]|uniref:Uncharacterized protein n=1 Tax=Mixia osmundae (strain CBS 9802 / IAM 14324 / JCM 22182 / KY 12970) TaxID=764103 RepID=G7E3M7_MIXOS|nr:uncharacterized protein L969DRAFT_87374 [Mixia osmundae IAM 14324]KEI39419.1 hypothetical protein L969DRAFT_87374 [Mixia osmundae IAM 14324]GAA97437.1 hypothetical protein E5Q_04115 [Mixia osmundae IAM 14324]